MFTLDKEYILLDIRKWKEEYIDVENLPIEFYLKYRSLLLSYKLNGQDKKSIYIYIYICNIANENLDISDFIYEIMDLIIGYCRPDFKIW